MGYQIFPNCSWRAHDLSPEANRPRPQIPRQTAERALAAPDTQQQHRQDRRNAQNAGGGPGGPRDTPWQRRRAAQEEQHAAPSLGALREVASRFIDLVNPRRASTSKKKKKKVAGKKKP